jgi:archaellum component FlaC
MERGDRMIAIVAPAIASFFPERYLNLNGYLKSLGVEAVFDVSFGAELTVASYIDHIKMKDPRMVISQPCPAVVNFIQIYHPKLLPYLAPVDSPMLHTVKMIREYYPWYRDHRVVAISPCIAKRREFDETGLIDYNVTMFALRAKMEEEDISLDSFPKIDYAGPPAERAANFSSPGGLLETAERFSPGIGRESHKIEGVNVIYPYLEELSQHVDRGMLLPKLLDCLNCEKGCNGGPGTGNHKSTLLALESPVRKRVDELEARLKTDRSQSQVKKYHRVVEKYWKRELYGRGYRDYSANNTFTEPNDAQLTEVYARLKKFKPEDIYNCTACGYGACKTMAKAIFNGINKPENCSHYTIHLLAEEKKLILNVNRQLEEHIGHALKLIGGLNTVVNTLSSKVDLQATAVDDSSVVTEKMISSIKATSEVSRKKQEAMKEMIENVARSKQSMKETIQSVQDISQSVDGIASTIKIISGIAANTNLLAMNAAIEAAHAGEAGQGFAVVADEIRRLSESTSANSRSISQTLSGIIGGISVTSKRSTDTDNLIAEMADEIDGFTGTMTNLINTLGELSSGSNEITTSLSALQDLTSTVKNSYAEMLSMTDSLQEDMRKLAEVTNRG